MTTIRWALAFLLALLVIAGIIVALNGHQEFVATRARAHSLELKGQVDALQEQAGQLVGQADERGKRAEAAEAEVQRLKAKLAKLQRPAVPASPAVPDPVGNMVPDPASDLKDQIIAALDTQVEEQKHEITGLRAALVLKDQALATSEQRARGLELALDAQAHAAKSGKWIGRLQGFAIGLGAGYISGRLK